MSVGQTTASTLGEGSPNFFHASTHQYDHVGGLYRRCVALVRFMYNDFYFNMQQIKYVGQNTHI